MRRLWPLVAFSVSVGVLTALACLAVFSYRDITPYSRLPESMRNGAGFPYRDDPEIGYAPQATFATRIRYGLESFDVFTDDRGARVGSAGTRSPDRVDVLSLGCSFAWGFGIEDEETYARLLERQTGLTVANLGVSGYGTVGSLLFYKKNQDLKPRLVIYGVISDHLRRNLSPCAPSVLPLCLAQAYVDASAGHPPELHGPIFTDSVVYARGFMDDVVGRPWGLRPNHLYYGARLLRERATVSLATGRSFDEPGARFRATQWLLQEFDALVRHRAAKLLIVYIPVEDELGTAIPEPLARSIPADAVLLDMTPYAIDFADRFTRAALYSPSGHPSFRYHALIAERIRVLLESAGLP